MIRKSIVSHSNAKQLITQIKAECGNRRMKSMRRIVGQKKLCKELWRKL